MRSTGKLKGLLAVGAVVVVGVLIAVGLTACGSSDSSSTGESGGSTAAAAEGGASDGKVSIDLGTETIEVETGTKPKIGFFAYGISTSEKAYEGEVEELREEGVDVTWVESQADPATQLKQLQTALTSGEYDAWIVEPVDAEGACRIVSEQAPEKGIPVSIVVQPVCGRSQKPWGEEVWAPGTLNTVAEVANVTWLTNVLKAEKKALGIGPDTEVGVVSGPEISSQTQSYATALEEAGIEPVEVVNSDYTPQGVQKLTQGMLARNPGIEVILTGWEAATPGIIPALKEAGKAPGEIKVADIGGSSEIGVANIESGWLTASAAFDPPIVVKTAVEQVEMAFAGEQGPRAVSADPPGASLTKPLLVTKENLAGYEPSY